MKRRKTIGLCPCGSRRPYRTCCGPFVTGDSLPVTPAELMRSRYTAYALGDAEYIIATTAPDGPRWESNLDVWRSSVAEFAKGCDFLGVDVHDTSVDSEEGEVHFTARLRRKRDDASFSEHSRFVRRDGRWLYFDGDPR